MKITPSNIVNYFINIGFKVGKNSSDYFTIHLFSLEFCEFHLKRKAKYDSKKNSYQIMIAVYIFQSK